MELADCSSRSIRLLAKTSFSDYKRVSPIMPSRDIWSQFAEANLTDLPFVDIQTALGTFASIHARLRAKLSAPLDRFLRTRRLQRRSSGIR